MTNPDHVFTKAPWQLITRGQFEKAVEVYTILYKQQRRPSHLYNRGLAYLNMEQYTAALSDFMQVLTDKEPRFRGSSELIFQGVCHWNLDQPNKAVQVWRKSLSAPYSDVAGGSEPSLLLFYAAVRLDDSGLRKEALHLLRLHARRKLREWPGILAPFILGKVSDKELEEQIKAEQSLVGRRQCQADFHIAIRAHQLGYWMEFQSGMIRCARSQHGYLEHEYYLAQWEIKHNFPKSAFP